MPGGPAREALRDLRTLFRFGVEGGASDGQLLDRFADRRDEGAEEAFAMLVRRHGAMVFGVCRRVLSSTHEAEDAFQATFLVLARKAATIARRETVANWLYGVALRTAKDARSRTLRRRAREKHVNTLRVIHAPGEDPVEDLRAILDEELARLPARLRAPVLLCELETLSRQEAAKRLGIPEGTLSSRLARAKNLLRDRLSRRGLGLSTALLTASLAREAQAAVVPHAMAEITIRAATLVAAGCSLTGLVAASVHSLTEEVCQAMFFAKLKGIVFGMLTVGAVTTGVMVLAQVPGEYSQPKPAEAPAAKMPPDYTQTKSADGPIANKKSFYYPQTKSVEGWITTRPDADRLHAVEQKLDRILEALGRPAPTPHAPAGGMPNPDLAPTSPSTTTTTTVESNDAAPATTAPPRFDRLSGMWYDARDPRSSSTDRLTGLERRMAELERRLAEIERHVYQGGPSASPASSASPEKTLPLPRADLVGPASSLPR